MSLKQILNEMRSHPNPAHRIAANLVEIADKHGMTSMGVSLVPQFLKEKKLTFEQVTHEVLAIAKSIENFDRSETAEQIKRINSHVADQEMFAIGQREGESINLWDGPHPSLNTMLGRFGRDQHSVLVSVMPNQEPKIKYSWKEVEWVPVSRPAKLSPLAKTVRNILLEAGQSLTVRGAFKARKVLTENGIDQENITEDLMAKIRAFTV